LVPRHRVTGGLGDAAGRRRGKGGEYFSSRPYFPGHDDLRDVDHKLTARLSTGEHPEFYIREHIEEEAIATVVILDRVPSMQNPPEGAGVPMLAKQDVAVEAGCGLVDITKKSIGGAVGYRDFANGELFRRAEYGRTRARRIKERNLPYPVFKARPGQLAEHLRTFRSRPGVFVAVCSDFQDETLRDPNIWAHLAVSYDPIPVVIQDLVWEMTFPDHLAPMTVPIPDPVSGVYRLTRISKGRAEQMREANEAQIRDLRALWSSQGIIPVELNAVDPRGIEAAFQRMAKLRKSRYRQ